MLKVNNKDTRTTPMVACCSVSVVNFEHVIVAYLYCKIWFLFKFLLQVQSFFKTNFEQQMLNV